MDDIETLLTDRITDTASHPLVLNLSLSHIPTSELANTDCLCGPER